MTSAPSVIPQRFEENVPLDRLTPHPMNANESDVGLLCQLIDANGFAGAVMAQESSGILIDGEHRVEAARSRGMTTVPVIWVDCTDDTRDRLLAEWNESTRRGRNDEGRLVALLTGLAQTPRGLEGTGFDGDDLDSLIAGLAFEGGGGGGPEPEARPSLADRFLIPPFSVLDARQGWWQDRKRAWIGLGIRSEIGRVTDANYAHDSLVKPGLATGGAGKDAAQLYGSRHVSDPGYYAKKRKGTLDADDPGTGYTSGTSVFDPVLCELAYRWFSPPPGHVIDPFAGGSVRGIVAATLGRTYAGNDLSAVQVTANGEQADDLAGRGIIDRTAVSWSAGDSAEWVTQLEPESADLIFTCPPYLWLERYSNDPADLSTMTEDAFAEAFTRILRGAADALKADRFAVLVVGDARDKRGRLADLHGLTVECAAKAGLAFHTTAVLVTACGSLPVRAARQFEASRILGSTHQDVLVFVKGDRKRAAKACGDVEVHIPDELAGAWDEGE